MPVDRAADPAGQRRSGKGVGFARPPSCRPGDPLGRSARVASLGHRRSRTTDPPSQENQQRRQDDYSGKKEARRKKNLLISSEKRVVYLGPTAAGSVHDKKLADQSGLIYPPDALVVKDTGFQGYEPPDTQTLQPKKKPRGRQLHPIQKTINQLVSRVRVTVEHAIAGVKRCRVVADTFRNWRAGMVDQVMLAASGLHNLRVSARP